MKKLLPILFFITLFLIMFIISANVTNFDYDLWARLIAGMGVIDGHTVLKADFLSYTPTHTWWDHEYGSGVVFYFFLKHFGAYSLILLQTVLCFLMFWIGVQIIKLRGGKSPYNFIFWIFPVIALAANFGSPIRCHIFSFLFFTLFLYILELVRRGRHKLIYILPLLVIIWNNLHGGVVSGLGLIAIFGLGEILEKKPFKHYIYAGLISLAALVINPWGWEYIKFLFMANLMARPDIAEWWGTFSKHQLGNQIPFKILLLLTLLMESVVLFKKVKTTGGLKTLWNNLDKTKVLLLLITLYLSVSHVKLIPFFVIVVSIYCWEDFQKYIAPKLPEWTQYFSTTLIFILCVTSFAIKKYELPIGAAAYPHREVEFIKINNIQGNVLVNFGLGSFVSYKLYPHNKIFMDGRYEEVYYDDMVPLLKKFYLLQEGWNEVLIKYPPDILIIEKTYPVILMLNQHPDWINVYETENFVVYLRKELVRNNFVQPANELEYYKNTLFDTAIKF